MKRKKFGYSLAEILVAIAVIGIGLVAVAGTLPVGLSYMRVVTERWNAIQLAQAKMEDAKNISYADLANAANNNVIWEYYYGSDPNADVTMTTKLDIIKEWQNKSYKYRIQPLLAGVDEKVVRIKVEIYWTENNAYGRMGNQRTFVLEGYKGEQGIVN